MIPENYLKSFRSIISQKIYSVFHKVFIYTSITWPWVFSATRSQPSRHTMSFQRLLGSVLNWLWHETNSTLNLIGINISSMRPQMLADTKQLDNAKKVAAVNPMLDTGSREFLLQKNNCCYLHLMCNKRLIKLSIKVVSVRAENSAWC